MGPLHPLHTARVGGDTRKDVPLGGWPTLLSAPKASSKEPGSEVPNLPIVEGCRVQFSGLKTKKNGATGITIKRLQDGKWKVMMDDNSGYALLKEDYLKGIATPEDAAGGVGISERDDAQEEAK